jgi:hypothetical protein
MKQFIRLIGGGLTADILVCRFKRRSWTVDQKPVVRHGSSCARILPSGASLAIIFLAFGAVALWAQPAAADEPIDALSLASRVYAYGAGPETDSSQSGALKIRDADGNSKSLPVKINVTVTATNWQTAYSMGSNAANADAFLITHTAGKPNQYWAPVHLAPGRDERLTMADLMSPLAPGADFSRFDLGLEFLRWPQQKIVKKEFHRQCACVVLESTNPDPGPKGYSRVVSWIDEDSLGIVEAYAYDASGNRLKNFYPKNLEKVNGRYQVEAMVMENLQTGSRSTFDFDPHQ